MVASSDSLSLPRCTSLSLAQASRLLRMGVSNLRLNSVVVPTCIYRVMDIHIEVTGI